MSARHRNFPPSRLCRLRIDLTPAWDPGRIVSTPCAVARRDVTAADTPQKPGRNAVSFAGPLCTRKGERRNPPCAAAYGSLSFRTLVRIAFAPPVCPVETFLRTLGSWDLTCGMRSRRSEGTSCL